MKNIKVSVITLTKNNPNEFSSTAYSIFEQVLDFSVEWLIIDGSNKKKEIWTDAIQKSFPIKKSMSFEWKERTRY